MDNSEEKGKITSFESMGLEDPLIRAIHKIGWTQPTLIQEKSILLAIEGKDLLIKGRTGCGKSGAFMIPILNQILQLKSESVQSIKAIVLAPSKELSKQLFEHSSKLNTFTAKNILITEISESKRIIGKPDIIISTPSAFLTAAKSSNLDDLKQTLKFLAIDESDLMFTYGYEKDLREIIENYIKEANSQNFLVSATLNSSIKELKSLLLKNPAILKLEEPELPDSDRLTQYFIECEEQDKFTLINALFKLRLIRGKSIIFVRTVDRCYRLKLFFEQFGIRSCILNSELPVASRCYIVNQYNRGIYETIIASDECCLEDPKSRKKQNSNTISKRKRDAEFSISRGIDFQNVSNVINFDFPSTVNAYIHRVGRTARGIDGEGTSLSFVSIKERPFFENVKNSLDNTSDFKPFVFRMEELEAFRYRSMGALRAVTSAVVRETRLKEIKRELLSSEKLKSYFDVNVKDFKVLKSDKFLHNVRQEPQLKNMPDYIIPPTLLGMVKGSSVKTITYDDLNDEQVIDQSVLAANKSSKPTKNKRRKMQKDPLKRIAS